jgi:hypothetical protein
MSLPPRPPRITLRVNGSRPGSIARPQSSVPAAEGTQSHGHKDQILVLKKRSFATFATLRSNSSGLRIGRSLQVTRTEDEIA